MIHWARHGGLPFVLSDAVSRGNEGRGVAALLLSALKLVSPLDRCCRPVHEVAACVNRGERRLLTKEHATR